MDGGCQPGCGQSCRAGGSLGEWLDEFKDVQIHLSQEVLRWVSSLLIPPGNDTSEVLGPWRPLPHPALLASQVTQRLYCALELLMLEPATAQ